MEVRISQDCAEWCCSLDESGSLCLVVYLERAGRHGHGRGYGYGHGDSGQRPGMQQGARMMDLLLKMGQILHGR